MLLAVGLGMAEGTVIRSDTTPCPSKTSAGRRHRHHICVQMYLVRKARRPAADARARIVAWSSSFASADTTRSALAAAVDLAAAHQLPIWDSIIVAVAVENRCELLLSEDLQGGFIWGGLTVVNPFAEPHTPLLDALLENGAGEGAAN
jgi:hypothetical protein